MPRDAVSRTAEVERSGGHKWVKNRLSGVRVVSEFKKYLQFFWTKDVNANSLGSMTITHITRFENITNQMPLISIEHH